MRSVQYYNEHAQTFHDRTINADLSGSYGPFLEHLPQGAHILDAGCGTGRDVKFFLSQGYKVTAFDASEEMTRLATKETGLPIIQMTFQTLNFPEPFDAVWTQASLLHVPYDETRAVYERIHKVLKDDGIFFAAYKYGPDMMTTEERDFYNMTEETIVPYLEGLFEIIEIWKQRDTRSTVAPSEDGSWLNFIVRKCK